MVQEGGVEKERLLDTVRGLVRPFIAVSLVSVMVYLFVTGKLKAEEILVLGGPIFGFYFGERSVKKNLNI